MAQVQGKIVQCIGAVVDVEFPRDQMPKIYDALKLEGSSLTLEVQQQLGDGVVRTIALGSSDGLRRGMMIQNTGKPIMVPVGKATLGRIMDVLGNPIDECGPVAHDQIASIHRTAPAYDELSPSQDLLETGIKVIDLVCPFAKGGKVGLFGCVQRQLAHPQHRPQDRRDREDRPDHESDAHNHRNAVIVQHIARDEGGEQRGREVGQGLGEAGERALGEEAHRALLRREPV
eukprot:gene18889-26746_t